MAQKGERGGGEGGGGGDFLGGGESLGEDKIGDIGTGNEENESDGTEKDEQGGTNVTDELFAQRKDGGAPALVIFGIELLEASGDGAELGLGLADINSGLEASDDEIVVIAANGALLSGPGEGHPNLSPIGELESVGHYTDDGIGLAIESNTPADDVGSGGEVVAPEFVAEEDDVTLAGAVLIGRKCAAEKRLDAKKSEKVGCYRTALNGFRAVLAAKGESVKPVGGQLFKRGTLALPVEVIGGGNREHGHAGKAFRGRHVPNLPTARGVFVGRRTKEG